jgi:hypothetical protein
MSAKNAPAVAPAVAPAPAAAAAPAALSALRSQVKGKGYGSNRIVYDTVIEAAFTAGAPDPTMPAAPAFADSGKESDALDKAALAFLKAISAGTSSPGAVMMEIIRRAAIEGMNVETDRGAVLSIQGKAAMNKAACGAGKPDKAKK